MQLNRSQQIFLKQYSDVSEAFCVSATYVTSTKLNLLCTKIFPQTVLQAHEIKFLASLKVLGASFVALTRHLSLWKFFFQL